MEKAWRTSEFWLVVIVVIFAAVAMSGVLTPARIETAASNIEKTAAGLPRIIEVFQKLFDQTGPLAIMAGLVWAFLKRRTDLKARQLNLRARTIELDAVRARMGVNARREE